MRLCTLICAALLAQAAPAAAPLATEPLRGTVYTADGKLAAGALVWAVKYPSGPLERQETKADPEGRFTFDLPPGEWFVFARRGTQGGEGPGRHRPVNVVLAAAPPAVEVHMEERGTFRGRLLAAETGKPIAGAKLYLENGVILTADDQGRVEIGGLVRDHLEAFVVAPGRMRMRVLFDTTARDDTELEVPVPRAGKIVGRVTDMKGQPIPGAYVGRSTSGMPFATAALMAACDAEGRFEYDDAVAPGDATQLAAGAPGFIGEELEGVSGAPGKPLELTFRLRPKPSERPRAEAGDKRRVVSGVIRAPNGNPLAGVLVRWGWMGFIGAIEARSDAQGRFRMTAPDEKGLVTVLPREFAPEFLDVAAGGDQTLEVRLAPANLARGRVIDDAGKPVRGVWVLALIAPPGPGALSQLALWEACVHTDAEGRFELKGIPEGARIDFMRAGMSDLRIAR